MTVRQSEWICLPGLTGKHRKAGVKLKIQLADNNKITNGEAM